MEMMPPARYQAHIFSSWVLTDIADRDLVVGEYVRSCHPSLASRSALRPVRSVPPRLAD